MMYKLGPRLFLALFLCIGSGHAETISTDVCIYGGTSGGIISAIQTAHMGKTVALVVFDKNLGGLTTGGLSATDKGNAKTIGGLTKEFYIRVGKHYNETELYNFEPHVARAVFEGWMNEVGVTPRFNQRLASVTKDQNRIVAITMEDGTLYRAKMFIDASYEGDLMARAGVSFTFGREGSAAYQEPLNGVRAKTPSHQFSEPVDPYIIPGKPESGLLPFVQAGDGGKPGDGDHCVQAYNYRLCFTRNETNKLPFVAPPNYDAARYELLGRLLDAQAAAGKTLTLKSFFNYKSLPNDKADFNNRGAVSTDYIGMNYTYPTNTYAERDRMRTETLDYTKGLVYYLANSPRSPASLRAELQSWGLCKDEWPGSGGYSTELYVREARRMVSDYIMTQANCVGKRVAEDPICLASYNMDSHNSHRVVQNGQVRNEGDVEVGVPHPFPIAYGAIVPRSAECENLFVTFAISASHIGFAPFRMEPVFMMTSQAAATAAVFAIDDNCTAQRVNYGKLARQLGSDSQILSRHSEKTSRKVAIR